MAEIEVNYNRVFCMAMATTPILKMITVALKALMHHNLKSFREKDEAQQNKGVLNLVKSGVYLTILLKLFPYLGILQSSFGQLPLWLAEEFEGIIYALLLIPLLYSYEISVSPKIAWTMWLHHLAAVAIGIIGLSKSLVGGENHSKTDESSSFVACLFCFMACLTVSLDFVFFFFIGMHNVVGRARTKEILMRCAIGPYCFTCTSITVGLFLVLAFHHKFMAGSRTLEFFMWFILTILVPEQIFPLKVMLAKVRKLQKQGLQEALDDKLRFSRMFPGKKWSITEAKLERPTRKTALF